MVPCRILEERSSVSNRLSVINVSGMNPAKRFWGMRNCWSLFLDAQNLYGIEPCKSLWPKLRISSCSEAK